MAFNSENGAVYQALSCQAKLAPKTKPFDYAVELQRLLMDDARNKELTASARSQVARAFVELEELKLRLKMKPAPKPIDVSCGLRKPKRSTAAGSFSETPANAPQSSPGTSKPPAA